MLSGSSPWFIQGPARFPEQVGDGGKVPAPDLFRGLLGVGRSSGKGTERVPEQVGDGEPPSP